MCAKGQETQPHFPRKSPIEPPSYIDIIFHQRNGRRSQYYFTSGHEHLGKPTNIDEEQLPFTLPQSKHLLAYFHRWKAKKTLTSQKKTKFGYGSFPKPKSILPNLQVEVELEKEEAQYKDPSKATAMTDINPDYFKDLKGRVLKERFSVRQYIDDIRDVLATRLLAGQERDDCIRIDQQFAEEQKLLNNIKKKCNVYAKSFEEFLSKDHEESMRILNEASEAEKRTAEMTAEKNQLSRAYGQVRLEVYFWEDAWRMVKQCQKFLYQVSPISWREEHDWIHKNKYPYSNSMTKQPKDIFSSTQDIGESTSILSLIDMFEQDIANAKTPELFFDDPLDLIRVFKTIELQNLNALIHLESLAGPMSDMAMTIAATEDRIKSEINEIAEGIKDLEDSIKAAEDRAASLERYANYLLHGVFRDLVCSEQVLYLRVFIEDAYEACVAPNDANLDSFIMMRSIEKTYEDLSLELDSLPHEVVVTCEKKGFRDEMKLMKEAEDATRKFELMHRLLAALKRIMDPPKPKKRPLMRRSAPKQQKSKTVAPQPPPTEEEQQFLNFFTNYRPQDDHNAFRAQFSYDLKLLLKNKLSNDSDQIGDNKQAEESSFFI